MGAPRRYHGYRKENLIATIRDYKDGLSLQKCEKKSMGFHYVCFKENLPGKNFVIKFLKRHKEHLSVKHNTKNIKACCAQVHSNEMNIF